MPGVLNLGFLSFDTGIALYCFLLCVVVDPGRCAQTLGMYCIPWTHLFV